MKLVAELSAVTKRFAKGRCAIGLFIGMRASGKSGTGVCS
jgi:hypothetical protein